MVHHLKSEEPHMGFFSYRALYHTGRTHPLRPAPQECSPVRTGTIKEVCMENKTLSESSDRRFALLIDADNVSARYLKPILNELSKYGTVTIKRIYGDWTLTLHAKWKDALLENSITPIQQFGYTQGKNATDSAMIIDAMDILYTDNVDGFCLVSSDSDFTRLASRLRESGRMVIGMGEKKTPTPFRRACDVFTTLELLVQHKRNERNGGGNAVPKDAVEQAVVDIITDNQNNGKATGLGEIGSRLQKRYPDFDVRNYGTNLLSKLLEEFTRVRITKDHSSVSVELADDEEATTPVAEHAEAPEERPERKSRNRRGGRGERAAKAEKAEGTEATGKAEGDEVVEGAERAGTASEEKAPDAPLEVEAAIVELPGADEEVVIETVVAEPATEPAGEDAAEPAPEAVAEPTAGEAPVRRVRSHRGTRRVAAKSADRPGDGVQEAAEESPKKAAAPQKSAQKKGSPQGPSSEKPAPKRSSRKKDASEKASKEPTPKEPTAPEKPASKKASSAKASSDRSTSRKSAGEKAGKTRKRPASSKAAAAPASDTPAGYIHQLVVEAGAEGVLLSTITDSVRAKFKDFKVRDLGFAQMRQYMASTGQYQLEKSGRNFRVRLS